ncbi:histone-lysine N-methyltransferase family member SUVH9 [Selaginella moellendorffii]|nr:histone-lysine N-methyltransferase family member SUVH9 [Selaginella moellendorffii]|eukprot:XP_002974013.2 histone-lysine N-methyltransferase family member SUVH9 [Selaginella moellendorffii]
MRPIAHRSWPSKRLREGGDPKSGELNSSGGGGEEKSRGQEAAKSVEPALPIAVRRWPQQRKIKEESPRRKDPEEENKRLAPERGGGGNERPKPTSLMMFEMDRARTKKRKSEPVPQPRMELSIIPRQSWQEARRRVKQAQERFEALRQKLEAKGTVRPDTAAMKQMRIDKQWVNQEHRSHGHVPGVEVFDVFSFRAELLIVGLHNHVQAGIGFLPESQSPLGRAIATSIILSGGYKDNRDNGDEFEYCGSGGNNAVSVRDEKARDQELTRGNLALANSVDLNIPVRVIRGRPSAFTPSRKEYRYDGLYDAVRCHKTEGANGCQVFKFLMRRCPGQPSLPLKNKTR